MECYVVLIHESECESRLLGVFKNFGKAKIEALSYKSVYFNEKNYWDLNEELTTQDIKYIWERSWISVSIEKISIKD